MNNQIDPYFRVEVIRKTPNPQQVMYAAMHQDYAEGFVHNEIESLPDEEEYGRRIVKHCLAGGRGHFGIAEHPQITFNVGWFPHSTMQQVRTHRVGVSFDCQSMRYTGQRICDVASQVGILDLGHQPDIDAIEEVFYLRPLGEYCDRKGAKYEYTQEHYLNDIELIWTCIQHYQKRIEMGFAEEHARGLIPFDVRQHWVMSANVRSLMHLLDLRWKADAQLEAQQLCELIWPHFEAWVPEISRWYEENRKGKARLAP